MKIYLVVGVVNTPGRVYGCFAGYAEAVDYRDRYLEDEAEVVERKLHYGQQLAPSSARCKHYREYVLP